MNIMITGGTGFVGTCLTEKLLERNDKVTIVGSSGKKSSNENPDLHYLKADTTQKGDWQKNIVENDVIVNLTGRSIFNYWSQSYKEKIYSSRVETTRNIVAALPQNSDTVLLSASAAGYYGDHGDTDLDESFPAGTDFLAKVCKDWENAAFEAEKKGTRVAVMRFGVVLGSQGGAIATMKTPFKLGLGGPLGSGKQWFPWIHIDDLVSAIVFLMDGNDLQGKFNFTAPGYVRQKDFTKELAKALNRPAFMPAPSFIMKLVAGEFGQSLLQGQKAIPKALLDSGFTYKYPQLNEALREIVNG